MHWNYIIYVGIAYISSGKFSLPEIFMAQRIRDSKEVEHLHSMPLRHQSHSFLANTQGILASWYYSCILRKKKEHQETESCSLKETLLKVSWSVAKKKCVNHVQRTINIINAFTLIWVLVHRNVSFKIRNHPFSESHLFSKITQRHETTTSAFISTVHSTLTTIKYEKCDSVVGQMKPSIKWSIFILPLSIVIPNNFMIHDAGVNPQQILNNLYEEEKNFSF